MYFFFQNGRIQDVSLQCFGNTVVVTGRFFSLTINDFLDVKIYIDLNSMCLNNDSSLSDNSGKTYHLQMNNMTINCPEYLDFWCSLRVSTENIYSNKETPIIPVYA